MSQVLPFLTLFLSFLFGLVLLKKIDAEITSSVKIFFSLIIGAILFSALCYFTSLIIGFSNGVILTNLEIFTFLILYIVLFKVKLTPLYFLKTIFQDRFLLSLLFLIGTLLIALFNTHIIPNLKGDLYTGESTYGDLPFHLATIAQIAYGNHFPPVNPLIINHPLVYPYMINFFSAILVYEGMSLRDSILIPGVILSIALVALVYDFAKVITKSNFKGFLATLLFFFNGGVGFYYFLKDNFFNFTSVIQSLMYPAQMKEYSHVFDQNIQWVNFLSRMIVPERSILFGIPAGIIILRILFFRDTEKPINFLEIILVSVLLSLMPLLHTHTAIVFAIILPILALAGFKRHNFKNLIVTYTIIIVLTIILAVPQLPLFFNHVGSSENFFKFHWGWMTNPDETFIEFWFKNSYLWIPLTLISIFIPKLINKQIKLLVFCGFILFLVMNIVLLSPYNWDNVKFLFWIGLFFSLALSSLFIYLLQYRSILTRGIIILIILTFFSSALLSLYREINLKYVLFSKESVDLGNFVKTNTPNNSLFLTYKIHNSPISNLAGRQIVMGYPGSLWVHGINYQEEDNDINQIFEGSPQLARLLNKYQINYVLLEKNDPPDLIINRDVFKKYNLIYSNSNYLLYKIK